MTGPPEVITTMPRLAGVKNLSAPSACVPGSPVCTRARRGQMHPMCCRLCSACARSQDDAEQASPAFQWFALWLLQAQTHAVPDLTQHVPVLPLGQGFLCVVETHVRQPWWMVHGRSCHEISECLCMLRRADCVWTILRLFFVCRVLLAKVAVLCLRPSMGKSATRHCW